MANAVQHTSEADTNSMPRQKWVAAPCPASCVEPIISTSPASVSVSPGSSAAQRRPCGLPSSMTQIGMVPIMSEGTSVPASRMASTSSR
jgi:hypothetical protein